MVICGESIGIENFIFLFVLFRVFFWSRIWMGHENGPMAHVHPFACKNQNFDGPFEVLMI